MRNVKIPQDLSEQCNYVIHSAAVACAGIGVFPVPGGDILPMCAVQVTMIMGLARIFHVPVSQELAEQMAKTFLLGNVGKFVAGQFAKIIPIVGSGVNATIAAGLTEYFGWEVAEDFWERSSANQ